MNAFKSHCPNQRKQETKETKNKNIMSSVSASPPNPENHSANTHSHTNTHIECRDAFWIPNWMYYVSLIRWICSEEEDYGKRAEKETWTLTEIICSFCRVVVRFFRQFIFNPAQLGRVLTSVSWHSVCESGERGIFGSFFVALWFWFNLVLLFVVGFFRCKCGCSFLVFTNKKKSPRLPKNKVVDIDAADK